MSPRRRSKLVNKLGQMQELMAGPGIEIVGPLPDELQGTFVFSVAIMTDANDVKARAAVQKTAILKRNCADLK